MAKKKEEKIVEEVAEEITESVDETTKKVVIDEPITIEEESIIDEPINEEETIDVIAPEITEEVAEGEVELEILVAFTDKYTGKSYKIGETHPFNKDRAKELLKDSRKLVK